MRDTYCKKFDIDNRDSFKEFQYHLEQKKQEEVITGLEEEALHKTFKRVYTSRLFIFEPKDINRWLAVIRREPYVEYLEDEDQYRVLHDIRDGEGIWIFSEIPR